MRFIREAIAIPAVDSGEQKAVVKSLKDYGPKNQHVLREVGSRHAFNAEPTAGDGALGGPIHA